MFYYSWPNACNGSGNFQSLNQEASKQLANDWGESKTKHLLQNNIA